MLSPQILYMFTLCLVVVRGQSSCPEDVFQYENAKNEEFRWFGELTLDSEFSLTGVWIKIVLNEKARLLGSSFSEVATPDNKEFVLKKSSYNLIPGQPLKVPIFVSYSPIDPMPIIEQVQLNGRTICPPQPSAMISGCPGILEFDENLSEINRWYGNLTIRSEYELQGINIFIVTDRQVQLLGSKFGTVESADNMQFEIKHNNHILNQGADLKVPIFIKYSELSGVPNVQIVRINGRTICGATSINPNAITKNAMEQVSNPLTSKPSSPLKNNLGIPGTWNPMGDSEVTTTKGPQITTAKPSTVPQSKDFSCGITESQDRIFYGVPTAIDRFPWHGAMFQAEGRGQLIYLCGMTLISRRHAITAAHCFYTGTSQIRNVRAMRFFFGLPSLRDISSPQVQSPRVRLVNKHPQYNFNRPSDDIAIITFADELQFNQKVRPVCLWEEDTDLRAVENKFGTVVGYGLTEVGTNSDQLLFADILIVSSDTCRELNWDFYGAFLRTNSFCAGNLKRSSVCQGDSGGGIFLKKRGKEVWQLRGITSTARRNRDTCDNTHYAIFTDAAKYLLWITDTLRKQQL